jgi:hypothetical protein
MSTQKVKGITGITNNAYSSSIGQDYVPKKAAAMASGYTKYLPT